MNLQIITPKGITYTGSVGRIQFRSAMGLMEILDNHAPLVAELCAGTIVTDAGDFDCGCGVVKVEQGDVKVICE